MDAPANKVQSIQQPPAIYSSTLNHFMRLLIQKLPKDQLRTFHSALKELDTGMACNSYGLNRYPLLELEAFADSSLLIQRYGLSVVTSNRQTLRRLKLGRELLVANDWNQDFGHLEENWLYSQIMMDFSNSTDTKLLSSPLLSLDSLHLIGVKLQNPLPAAPLIITRLELLQVLCLESCIGTPDLLKALASAPNVPTKALLDFLSSFDGLQHLSILLDHMQSPFDLKNALIKNAATLKTLVLDCREQPRKEIVSDPSLQIHSYDSFDSGGDMIGSCCNKLEEAGLTIRWGDDGDDDEEGRNESAQGLSRMSNLRLLNIRNLPTLTSKVVDFMSSTSPEDSYAVDRDSQAIESFLRDFLRYSVPYGCKRLELIAIGSSTISDRMIDKGLDRSKELDDFLKPRVYYIKHFFSIDGESTFRLKLVGEGITALTGAQRYSSFTKVLEPCWAR
ncbi:hypothetical protein MMC13_004799 [Lambiella insularis]|nr:hypothetical protein [Lambiella insularis]